jgi:hypothetical protein
VKPVNLNQLLFHPRNSTTLSFFQPQSVDIGDLEQFVMDMQTQLELRGKHHLAKLLDKNKSNIKKILNNHPTKCHGFFFSEKIQGYIALETRVESYCMIGNTFHVRPMLEELFVNPEYLVVNVSLYDIKVYRGDFLHLEIIQQYDFEQFSFDLKSRVFNPNHVGLVPFKSILALRTIAKKIMDITQYDSLPILVTGLDDMRSIFLKSFSHPSGLISHINEDFYEKTCVEILEKCKKFRYAVIDYYSAQFKEKLKRMLRSKRLISDLSEIIAATIEGKVIQLVIPTEKKLYGKISFVSGEFEVHKKFQKKNASVDILNELAEQVIRQGGKIQILAPHFFPQDAFVLAILRGK